MPIGSIGMTILVVMIAFGLAGRALARLRLPAPVALLWALAALIGSPFAVALRAPLIINVGGGLLPLLLALWLIATTDQPWERWRALSGAGVASAAVAALGRWFPVGQPTELNLFYMDASYLYTAIAALLGFLCGRTHRAAFVAGMLGVLLGDSLRVALAGEGALPAVGGGALLGVGVLTGALAVALTELVGLPEQVYVGQSRGPAGE